MLSAIVFGVTAASIGTVEGWSRLATGSVWPAVLLHATWNTVIHGAFDPDTLGDRPLAVQNLWVGESGILVAASAAVLGFPLAR